MLPIIESRLQEDTSQGRKRYANDTTDKMRAARYYGKGDVRIEHDVPEPPQQLGEGMVRVKPAFVGICGTGMNTRYLLVGIEQCADGHDSRST